MPKKKKRTNTEMAEAIGLSRGYFQVLMKDDAAFAKLVKADAGDEALMVYLANREFDEADKEVSVAEVAKRRKFAEMRLAEGRAELVAIEIRVAERDLWEAADVKRIVGRSMQSLNNDVMGLPAKVRALLVEYVAPTEATAIEQEVYELARESLDKAATTVRDLV